MYYAVLQEFRFSLPEKAMIAKINLGFYDRSWLKLMRVVPMCTYREYYLRVVLKDGRVLRLPIGFHQKHKARLCVAMFNKQEVLASYHNRPYVLQPKFQMPKLRKAKQVVI